MNLSVDDIFADKDRFKEYMLICDHFGLKDNRDIDNYEIHPLLRYFIIYNGLFCLLYVQWYTYYGFDGFLGMFNWKFNELETQEEEAKLFLDLLLEHVLSQLCLTDVFGDYFNPIPVKSKPFTASSETRRLFKKNEEAEAKCKELLFNNNLDLLKELLVESTQDIKHNVISYANNSEKCSESGLTAFIIHRLSFRIFDELMIDKLNSKCNDASKVKQLKYPSMIKLYKFVWNFSIYCHCYSHKRGTWQKEDEPLKTNQQTFVLTQYFNFRHWYVMCNIGKLFFFGHVFCLFWFFWWDSFVL